MGTGREGAGMTADPILLLEEAAALLRVSPRWLQRSACPRIRAGGTVRFDREATLAWFRSFLDAQAA
jgi:hypothetical protein